MIVGLCFFMGWILIFYDCLSGCFPLDNLTRVQTNVRKLEAVDYVNGNQSPAKKIFRLLKFLKLNEIFSGKSRDILIYKSSIEVKVILS
jgi:hypothetical protein